MRRRGSLPRSFACAAAGVVHALRTQRNLRIHLAATFITVILSWSLNITVTEWAVILLAIGFVWTAELLNTAIEAIVDLVSPDEHELARIAKDVSSGAVLIAAAISVCIGAVIFGPLLWVVIQ